MILPLSVRELRNRVYRWVQATPGRSPLDKRAPHHAELMALSPDVYITVMNDVRRLVNPERWEQRQLRRARAIAEKREAKRQRASAKYELSKARNRTAYAKWKAKALAKYGADNPQALTLAIQAAKARAHANRLGRLISKKLKPSP